AAIRSTSSSRSSTRAWRSASRSPSTRSSRRTTWFISPRTSARWRALGRKWSWRLCGRLTCISAVACASASSASRARASVASTSPGSARRVASCSFARSIASTAVRLRCGSDVKASELDYDLPPELIAQHPAERRDESRLLVYERSSGDVRHRVFRDLPEELRGELVVVNDTRVLPARIPIERPRGEVLLLEQVGGDEWEGLARPTRRLRAGRRYGPVELLEHLGEGRWRLRLYGEPAGDVPLPPYITEPLADPERYQTTYAREQGSAAAPTAGLHL